MSRVLFQCCKHGKHQRKCKKCQIWTFLCAVRKNDVFKDVKRTIVSMLIRQPTEFVYCCRCEVGFGILSAKELDDNGYESSAVFAEDCDAEVTFLKKKVIIAAGEFSEFGEDGYTVTAGVFIDPSDISIHLTLKQVQETYKAENGALVCDDCIKIMRKLGELGGGGEINEELQESWN